MSATEARYGTTQAAMPRWQRWHDPQFDAPHGRDVTEVERLLVGLLTPARLLEFVRGFVLFDRRLGRVVARDAQFFGVLAVLQGTRLRLQHAGGQVLRCAAGRSHGVTMTLLARALLQDEACRPCRVVLVTDRTDTHERLVHNHAGGAARSTTGRALARRIGLGAERLCLAPTRKFRIALGLAACRNESPDVVVVLDEGEGLPADARLRKALPRATVVVLASTPAPREPGPVAAALALHEPDGPYRAGQSPHTAHPQADPYPALLHQVLGEARLAGLHETLRHELAEQALAVHGIVARAVAENSLHPQNAASAIRTELLPRLHPLIGLLDAKAVIEQVISRVLGAGARGHFTRPPTEPNGP